MLQMDCIDILMATYNGEKYLREQLDSILNQTYTNFNLIISDDNSKDNTFEILKEYEHLDKRIKVYKQDKNLGYRKNFEFLCSISTSDYIIFADQDDVWESNKVELMNKYIKSNDYTLAFCDLQIVDENLSTLYPSMIGYMNKKYKCRYNDYRAINLDNIVTGCALITTKDVIKRAIPFPEKAYPHDWWIALVATQIGKIGFIDKQLVKYRQHNSNTIGIKSQNLEVTTFEQYRNEIIQFHLQQFEVCNDRINIFNDEYKKVILNANWFFKNIDKHPKHIFKKIKAFFIIYKGEKINRKLKHLLLYSFPLISKALFNIRRKFL